MLPNTYKQLEDIINTSTNPILVLVVSDDCDSYKSAPQIEMEEFIKTQQNITYTSFCVPEEMVAFPRLMAPVVYYFTPGNQIPAFYRHQGFLSTINQDIEIIRKMMTGLTYDEARFTEEERKQIDTVETFLKEESTKMSEFPSAFQQARNLAKEMWKTGKNMARGLPVLVPADIGLSRYQTCESCEHFEAEPSRCKQCGCFMKTKTQLASASCPVNKWEAYTG